MIHCCDYCGAIKDTKDVRGVSVSGGTKAAGPVILCLICCDDLGINDLFVLIGEIKRFAEAA